MDMPLSQQLRTLAAYLRKQAADPALPKPVPNPVASRAKGDLGSLENVGRITVPKVPGTIGASNV